MDNKRLLFFIFKTCNQDCAFGPHVISDLNKVITNLDVPWQTMN